MVVLLQVLGHVFHHLLGCDVDFFHYSLVNVSNDLLDHFELLKQFLTSLKNILGEDVLFSVDPEVRESFLC